MGLTATDILFYSFALIAAFSAVLVVFVRNPIYSALFLALSMSVLGALFFILNAYFIAVAQITVYAGAVMVLFVMVIMLFDLRHEVEDLLKFSPVTLAKLLSAAVLCGFLVGAGWLAVSNVQGNPAMTLAPGTTAQDLAKPEGATLSQAAQPVAQTSANATPAPTTDVNGADQATTNPDEDLTAAEAAKLVEKINNPPAAPVNQPQVVNNEEFGSTASLSKVLFSKYVFAFEAVSLLLLVAIVGAVALAKSRGGTHHAA